MNLHSRQVEHQIPHDDRVTMQAQAISQAVRTLCLGPRERVQQGI